MKNRDAGAVGQFVDCNYYCYPVINLKEGIHNATVQITSRGYYTADINSFVYCLDGRARPFERSLQYKKMTFEAEMLFAP